MAKIWTVENKFQKMLLVEKTVAKGQAELKIIPKKMALTIESKAQFNLKDICLNEQKTRHDVTAFVNTLASSVGEPAASYIHLGLTSSDVLDTAFSLQIRDAWQVLEGSFTQLEQALKKQVKKHADTLCVGRTHGMWAEPITFGLKLKGFLLELVRNRQRVEHAIKQACRCKLSGAVGCYHVLPKELENRVCKKLKLPAETLATQVVPRDRHAEVIVALAITAGGLERLAVEIRHLQKEETGEVEEAFVAGQTGSSAMPHKKNPIYSENITGLCRLLRSYTGPALENIVLWHERDISHSSVERVIFPSAFILCDFALTRLTQIVKHLKVNKDRMLQHLQLTGGKVFSSRLLMELIKAGCKRSEAYKLLQSIALQHHNKLAKKPVMQEVFQNKVIQNKGILKYLSKSKLQKIFSSLQNKKYRTANFS